MRDIPWKVGGRSKAACAASHGCCCMHVSHRDLAHAKISRRQSEALESVGAQHVQIDRKKQRIGDAPMNKCGASTSSARKIPMDLVLETGSGSRTCQENTTKSHMNEIKEIVTVLHRPPRASKIARRYSPRQWSYHLQPRFLDCMGGFS